MSAICRVISLHPRLCSVLAKWIFNDAIFIFVWKYSIYNQDFLQMGLTGLEVQGCHIALVIG